MDFRLSLTDSPAKARRSITWNSSKPVTLRKLACAVPDWCYQTTSEPRLPSARFLSLCPRITTSITERAEGSGFEPRPTAWTSGSNCGNTAGFWSDALPSTGGCRTSPDKERTCAMWLKSGARCSSLHWVFFSNRIQYKSYFLAPSCKKKHFTVKFASLIVTHMHKYCTKLKIDRRKLSRERNSHFSKTTGSQSYHKGISYVIIFFFKFDDVQEMVFFHSFANR